MARPGKNARRYRKGGLSPPPRTFLRPASAGHLGDFGREIVGFLLDALAKLEADEACDLDGRASILGGLLDGLTDLGLAVDDEALRSEEHTSELQSLMRISYA